MICAACGSSNRDGARFCQMCATPLAPSAPQPQWPTPAPAAPMPCPACGSPIAADDTFCGFCGYAKEEQGQWRPPAPPQAPTRAFGPAAQGSPRPMPSGTRAFPGIVWSVREPGTNLSDLPDGRRTLVRLNAGTRVREEGR